MTLGEKLFELRKQKNLSQEEVAEKLNVTRQTISKWETDQSTPDLDKIIPLCDLYEISADYLLTGKETKEENYNDLVKDDHKRKEMKAKKIALGILLYFLAIVWIMISIPVLDLNPIVSAAIFLAICGVATYQIVYTVMVYKKEKKKEDPNKKLIKQINEVVSIVMLVIYLVVSFTTMAWHITWILWIINGLIEEIVKLVFQLKEVQNGK